MGNVEGSLNIPLNEVPDMVEDFRNMSKPIIMCCASGNRSGQAVQFLRYHGIEEVYNAGSWGEVKIHKM
jgi:phage shock protein E